MRRRFLKPARCGNVSAQATVIVYTFSFRFSVSSICALGEYALGILFSRQQH